MHMLRRGIFSGAGLFSEAGFGISEAFYVDDGRRWLCGVIGGVGFGVFIA